MFFKYKNIVIACVIIYNYVWRAILILYFFYEFDNDYFVFSIVLEKRMSKKRNYKVWYENFLMLLLLFIFSVLLWIHYDNLFKIINLLTSLYSYVFL